jgi:His/Glu/Gln/Arg/opine family amino acid ABC transporter permease subunit
MLQGYGTSLLEGAALTLAVAFLSLAIAVLLGLAGTVAKLSRHRLARELARIYTTVVRGVPDLVLMLLVFFGGQTLVNSIADRLGCEPVDVDPFLAGTLTIGFIFGGYMTEIFRGAFLAVPAGQREAALAYGMTPAQVLVRVVGPQALRHALAPLSNCWLVMLKSTAIVSLIGLSDLMQRAATASGSTREPFLFYGAAALLYLVFTSVSELVFAWLRRRYAAGVRQVSLD